jgi:hypothetical protein
MTDSRIEKWRRWCEGSIRSDVVTMHAHRDTFQEVHRIAAENGQLPDSYFWDFLRDTYATSQAVAVRRQAETDAQVCTLGRLLVEITGDSQRLTRAFWVGMWDPGPQPSGLSQPLGVMEANRQFDEYFACSTGEHLDPEIPRDDLTSLTAAAASVKTYVDQHVAHSDARPQPGMPTFDDLNSAIDMIGHLFRRYASLLTAASYTLVPVHQDDWLAVFRQPWIRPRQD